MAFSLIDQPAVGPFADMVEDMEVEMMMPDEREEAPELQSIPWGDTGLPSCWEKMPPGKLTVAVNLRPESEEYTQVLLHFLGSFSISDVTVNRIFRIQNPFLFKHVKLKFQEMKFERPNENCVGDLLFHGTKVCNVDSICRKGFDRRLSTRTKYGDGCYFALRSSFSHSYSPATDGSEEIPQVLQTALDHVAPDPRFPFTPFSSSSPSRLSPPAHLSHPPPQRVSMQQPAPLQQAPSQVPTQVPSLQQVPTMGPVTAVQSGPIDLSMSFSSPPQRTLGSSGFFSFLPLPVSSTQSSPVGLSTSLHAHIPPTFPPSQVHPLDLSYPTRPLDLSVVPSPHQAPKGLRYMFASWVLTGRPVRGHTAYRRPPPLHPGHPQGPSFDSCVDQERDPNLVVVFDNYQAYPFFVVEYSCAS